MHRAPVLEQLEARAHIGIARAGLAAQQVALGEQRREPGGEQHTVELARFEQHVREARMHRQARHVTAVRGDAAVARQRAEPREQLARLGEHRRRRCVEPGERASIPSAPRGELQRQRGKICLRDLRRRKRCERRLCAFAPGAIAHARCEASGTPAALLGRRTRDAHGLQAPHAGRGIETRTARESRIDHRAHPGERQARLGDVGGEHDLARAGGRWRQRRILLGGRELAVERQHLHAGPQLARVLGGFEQLPHATDLTRPREKHQHVARSLAQRAPREARDQLLGGIVGTSRTAGGEERRAAAGMMRLDGKTPAGNPDQRRSAEQLRHGRAVERGRHDENPESRSELGARIQTQRETEIRLRLRS